MLFQHRGEAHLRGGSADCSNHARREEVTSGHIPLFTCFRIRGASPSRTCECCSSIVAKRTFAEGQRIVPTTPDARKVALGHTPMRRLLEFMTPLIGKPPGEWPRLLVPWAHILPLRRWSDRCSFKLLASEGAGRTGESLGSHITHPGLVTPSSPNCHHARPCSAPAGFSPPSPLEHWSWLTSRRSRGQSPAGFHVRETAHPV